MELLDRLALPIGESLKRCRLLFVFSPLAPSPSPPLRTVNQFLSYSLYNRTRKPVATVSNRLGDLEKVNAALVSQLQERNDVIRHMDSALSTIKASHSCLIHQIDLNFVRRFFPVLFHFSTRTKARGREN